MSYLDGENARTGAWSQLKAETEMTREDTSPEDVFLL